MHHIENYDLEHYVKSNFIVLRRERRDKLE